MVSGGLAVVMGLLASDPRRALGRSWTSGLTWLSCFVMWTIFSIPGSLWPGGSFFLVFDDFIKTAIVIIVVVASVRSHRDVERLMLAYFTSAAIYAAVAFLRLGGGSGRVESFYMYDANDYAAYVVTALPMGIYFMLRGHRTWLRFACLIGSALLMLTFLKGQSRGGFLGLVGGALAMLAFFRAVPLGRRLTITAVGVAVFMALAGPEYLNRIETIWKGEEDYNRTSETGRIEIWKRGIGYMVDRPIFGVGAGMFGTAEGKLSPLAKRQEYGFGLKWSAAHNTYIQIGAELGVPGILFFLLIVATTLKGLFPIVYATGDGARSPPVQAQALLGSLSGFLVGAVFLSLGYYPMFYTVAGLAMGLIKVQRAAARATSPTPSRMRRAARSNGGP